MGFSPTIFQDNVPEDFLCVICKEVVKPDIVMLHPCEHLFCLSCIETLDSDSCCPKDSCQTTVTNSSIREPYPFIRSIYGNLSMTCSFYPECEETVKASNYESHITECSYNPQNNIVCDNCSTRLTIATEPSHNCFDVFRSQIEELLAENRQLMEEFEQLNARKVSTAPTTTLAVSESSENSPLSRERVLQMLKLMTGKLRALKKPSYIGDKWEETQFLRSLLPLANNSNVARILRQTDLSKLVYIEKIISKNIFCLQAFKRNTILFMHYLIFQLLEPLIEQSSKVLILDYIDHGLSNWLAAHKAEHVTVAVNPELLDSYRQQNFMGPFADIITYVEFPTRNVSKLIKEIQYIQKEYSVIVGFTFFPEHDIKKILQKFSSQEKGLFISFSRDQMNLRLYTLSTDSSGEPLISSQTLLNPADLTF